MNLVRAKLKIAAVVYVQKIFRGWKIRKDSQSAESHAAATKIQR
jgi:hypothetical protein